MAQIRYEIWERQESGTFALKAPLADVIGDKLDFSSFGRGSVTVASDHPQLDNILFVDPSNHANDDGSVIRGYVGQTVVGEFYAARMGISYNETGQRVATITGGGPGTALDRVRVRQFDWGATVNPSITPNWDYGVVSLLGENAGLEDNQYSLTNPGAEDQSTLGWTTTGNNSGGQPNVFDAINSTPNADTGDWYFLLDADVGEGVFQNFDFDLEEDETYTVTARVYVQAVGPLRMEVTNAKSVSVGSFFNKAAYVDTTTTGAYETLTVTFVADANTGGNGISFLSQTAATVARIDTITVSGFGTGTAQWQKTNLVTVFQTATSPVHSGTFSLEWKPTSGILGNDRIYIPFNTTPGQEIAASVWIYHTEGADRDFRMVIRKIGVDPNSSNVASVLVGVPTATWTQISGSGTATSTQHELEVRYDETGVPTNTFFADDVAVSAGRPEDFWGVILGELLDDAATDHSGDNRTALAWLTKTFSDTTDSSSASWVNKLNISIKRGVSYRQVGDLGSKYAYEHRIRTNPADETEWLWDVYIEGNMGTDHDAVDGPSIIAGEFVVSVSEVVRKEPQATYVMAEGDELYWADARDTNKETVWGEIEDYTGTKEYQEGSLGTVATTRLNEEYTQSLRIVLAGDGLQYTPGVDYIVGDKLRISLGEAFLPSAVFRVVEITGRNVGSTAHFQVEAVQIEEPEE